MNEMNETEKLITRRAVLGGSDATFEALRELICEDVLRRSDARDWSVQGFGMLRTYLSRRLRLHVWDPRYRVPNVTEIHDHPWHFESTVLFGRMRNVIYKVAYAASSVNDATSPVTHTLGRIMRGPAPTEPDEERGVVRLVVEREELIEAGRSYAMRADELHASYPDAGTVTICRRTFAEDRSADHALVCWPVGGKRVSAEPRAATHEEVQDIIEALWPAVLNAP